MTEETQEQKDERMSWELFPDIPSQVIQPLPCPFCGAKNIVSQVEIIKSDYINQAYERTIASDVKYRFVIDGKTF